MSAVTLCDRCGAKRPPIGFGWLHGQTSARSVDLCPSCAERALRKPKKKSSTPTTERN